MISFKKIAVDLRKPVITKCKYEVNNRKVTTVKSQANKSFVSDFGELKKQKTVVQSTLIDL